MKPQQFFNSTLIMHKNCSVSGLFYHKYIYLFYLFTSINYNNSFHISVSKVKHCSQSRPPSSLNQRSNRKWLHCGSNPLAEYPWRRQEVAPNRTTLFSPNHEQEAKQTPDPIMVPGYPVVPDGKLPSALMTWKQWFLHPPVYTCFDQQDVALTHRGSVDWNSVNLGVSSEVDNMGQFHWCLCIKAFTVPLESSCNVRATPLPCTLLEKKKTWSKLIYVWMKGV